MAKTSTLPALNTVLPRIVAKTSTLPALNTVLHHIVAKIWLFGCTYGYGTARLRSSAFLSQVRPFSIPGPRTFRRGSPTKLRTWDTNPTDLGRNSRRPGTETPQTGDTTHADRGRFSAFCTFWRRRSPTKLRTGDAKVTERGRSHPRPGTVFGILYLLASQVHDKTTDLGRKPHGPGTARWWTGDGKPTDRTQNGHGPETHNSRGKQNSPRNSATPWQRTSSGTGSSRWSRR